jgi:hypothetical protein
MSQTTTVSYLYTYIFHININFKNRLNLKLLFIRFFKVGFLNSRPWTFIRGCRSRIKMMRFRNTYLFTAITYRHSTYILNKKEWKAQKDRDIMQRRKSMEKLNRNKKIPLTTFLELGQASSVQYGSHVFGLQSCSYNGRWGCPSLYRILFLSGLWL